MELHGDVRFAAPAKLATSSAASGNLPVRGGAGRHWNDKGALRMWWFHGDAKVNGATVAEADVGAMLTD